MQRRDFLAASAVAAAALPLGKKGLAAEARNDVRGTLRYGKIFAEGFAPGITDGMAAFGTASVGGTSKKQDGVRRYSRYGELLGQIHLPETCAKLVFGGLRRNRLYVCASTSVYACEVNTKGAAVP